MRPIVVALAVLAAAPAARAQPSPWGAAKGALGGAAVQKLQKQLNARLLEEGRKNQCAFKVDSDALEPGCDAKARRLANAVIDAKKKLEAAGVKSFKFTVSGHTDTSGDAQHNQALSARRAEAIRKQLVAKGVPEGDIEAVGMGARRPLVKPDDTPAKKAKNRRYEVQVTL